MADGDNGRRGTGITMVGLLVEQGRRRQVRQRRVQLQPLIGQQHFVEVHTHVDYNPILSVGSYYPDCHYSLLYVKPAFSFQSILT